MIRRILHVHGELLMNITICLIAIAAALLGYGERQQTDEFIAIERRGAHGTAHIAVRDDQASSSPSQLNRPDPW